MSVNIVLIKEYTSESEDSSQSSTTSESNHMDQSMDNQSKSSLDLTLNLSSNLKSDIVNGLVRYSCLLRGQSVKADDRMEMFNLNTELMQRLSVLMSSENEATDNDNLVIIDESFLKDSIEKNGGLFFELNLNTRLKIFELLIKNFNFIFLSKYSECEKDNLIKENNKMVNLLINLISKTLNATDSGINRIGALDNLLSEKFDQLTILKEAVNKLEAKVKEIDNNLEAVNKLEAKVTEIDNSLEAVNKLEAKVTEIDNSLEIKLKKVDINSNEVTFSLEIKDIEDFLSTRKQIISQNFYCNSIPWRLVLISNREFNGIKNIEFYLHVENNFTTDFIGSIKADFNLLLLHHTNSALNRSCAYQFTFDKKIGYGNPNFISHDDLVAYIKDNTIKLRIDLKTELFHRAFLTF